MRFIPAEICLPDFTRVDAEKWAVIACDQFTSEPAYWDACRALVGDAPSTLHMILPEAWLGDGEDARIAGTTLTMRSYRDTILRALPPAYIYVERTLSDGRVRAGLIGAIDLEDYDYRSGAESPIRATEQTVTARIPPRVRIRQDAIYELPHVLLLADDPTGALLSPYAGGRGLTRLYDTPLMLGGGSITGWRVPPSEQARIEAVLARGAVGEHPLILAVGDGNHSLAAAKTIYERHKAEVGAAALTSPLRYALVEVTDLRAESIAFAPIYRLATGVSPEETVRGFARFLREMPKTHPQGGKVTLVTEAGEETLSYDGGCHPLTAGVVDAFLATLGAEAVDYIHGEASLRTLSAASRAVGFLFAGIRKDTLFATVAADGSLPRKTFSLGQARDKRYYMEARLLASCS